MTEKKSDFFRFVLFWGIILLLCWLTVRYLLPWFLPFLIALAAAYMMEPTIVYLRQHLHLKRGFISGVLSFILLGLLLAVLTILCANLFQQLTKLLQSLPTYLESLPSLLSNLQGKLNRFCAACPKSMQSWMEELLTVSSQQLRAWVGDVSAKCLQAVADALAALPSALLFTGTTVLAIFFTAAAFPSIMDFLRRQLPPDRLHEAGDVKENLLVTLSRWLKSQCVLLLITFLELLFGFFVIRQPYALLLASVIAIVDALPVFGTGTVLLPWAAICLLLQNTPKGIALAALYAVISLVRSFLEPKIMAAQVNLPPLAALIAMYIGFCTFRVVGMILFPIGLLFLKRLHDAGYLKLWK